ncbi:ATP/GTP-binding protein [Actinoallomurus vinaceus]|uniref:ATP/GTP-binding protein n=1 Tax=Actinoallomurus vinaceus TaxID=1080074 RepID=A0ABP8U532_9ACTN
MSRPDLRGVFRTNNRSLASVDVFANREEEWAAVSRGLASVVAARRNPTFDVEDVQTPRCNVLVFYGVGGIGKTTLSQRISEHLSDPEAGPTHWLAPNAQLGRVIPIRIDLSRQFGANLETVVLAVRLAAANLGRPMRAFDLAFYRYWEHNHPGETLEEYLRRHTFFRRFSSRDSLRGQMEAGLEDIAQALTMPGMIGSLAGQGLRLVVRALRDRRQKARALAGCRRLPDILEAEPDTDALSYYPHLLAWDLAQLPEERTATPVILLDTFEDVGDRTHRDFERLIQRMAWLLPNALFVITGRNRLQWDDTRLEGQLDWVGAHCWPQLVSGAAEDPRQYRVGYLAEDDAQDYLQRRLTVGDRPLMDDRTRRVIIAHSQGLPLYLDLAVMRFLDLYERLGHAPDVSEFSHDFPALVARTFRDLTVEERQVLRAVSLLDAFSVELATTAAGMDRDAPALQLTERPFVDADPGAPWPYHLHDVVRAAVRDADSSSEDRWSDADWRRASQRAFDALGREFADHGGGSDRRRLIGCLRQGLTLARDFDLELGWLVDAAFTYVADFVWEPIDVQTVASSARGTPQEPGGPAADGPAVALAEALTTIAGRQREHRAITADRLRTILAAGSLPSGLDELPRYFLAECDRDLGNLTASLDGMRRVADGGGRLAADASRGLLHLARRLGRFPEVLAAVDELSPQGRKHRTLGDLWWTQGDIGLACSEYARGRDDALGEGRHGEAALSQACLAFAAAFQDRARAREQIDRAERMLAGTNARFAELQVRNARLLQDCGRGGRLPEQAEAVAALATENGLSSSVAYARFAACYHAAILQDPELIAASRDRLRESVHGDEFAYLLELTYLMLGEEPPADLSRARWIDGVTATADRWTRLVADRQRELTSMSGD